MKYVMYSMIAVVLLGVGGLYYLGQKSQGGEAMGLIDGGLAPCSTPPNCVASETSTSDDKRVEPLPVEVWLRLPSVIVEMGGIVTKQGDNYISSEFSSETFQFVDDVEFRLTKGAVHVRSASRVGYSDNGVNAARVAALRAKL
ncbi:MAG: DUF1499 domain-containing protein [Pseudomonadota bacterium]